MPYDTKVSVTYHLQNQGEAKIVDYVFPVDIFQNFDDINWEIKDISFLDGEKELHYEMVEQLSSEDWKNKIKDFHEYEFPFYNQHQVKYLSSLSFAEQEEKVLTVSYTVKNGYMGWGVSSQLQTRYDDIVFAYDLQPAAYWGNGCAKEFTVTIDYSALEYAENLFINMPDFIENDDKVYTYSANDYAYLEQGYITVVYEYPFDKLDLAERVLDADRCIEHMYAPDMTEAIKCLDGEQTTFATILPDEPYFLELFSETPVYLGILNGARVDEETYYAYSRIKTLQVTEFVTNPKDGEVYTLEKQYELPDQPYVTIDVDWLLKDVEVLDEFGYEARPVALTIVDTYPGERYPEVALSEIYLFGEDWGYDFDDMPMEPLDGSGLEEYFLAIEKQEIEAEILQKELDDLNAKREASLAEWKEKSATENTTEEKVETHDVSKWQFAVLMMCLVTFIIQKRKK